eukprot:3711277-Rhodomonas_salina.2
MCIRDSHNSLCFARRCHRAPLLLLLSPSSPPLNQSSDFSITRTELLFPVGVQSDRTKPQTRPPHSVLSAPVTIHTNLCPLACSFPIL